MPVEREFATNVLVVIKTTQLNITTPGSINGVVTAIEKESRPDPYHSITIKLASRAFQNFIRFLGFFYWFAFYFANLVYLKL